VRRIYYAENAIELKMDSEDEDYEFDVDPVVPSDRDHNLRLESHRPLSPSSSEQGDKCDKPLSTPASLPGNGHPQCPSFAGISDGTGRPSVHPRPSIRRVSLGSRRKGAISHVWPLDIAYSSSFNHITS